MNNSVNAFIGSVKDSLNKNTRRTTDLINKVSEKGRIIHKLGANKKDIRIQKVFEKFNVRNKSKQHPVQIKNERLITLGQDENNKNLMNIQGKHMRSITDQNLSLKKNIEKINKCIDNLIADEQYIYDFDLLYYHIQYILFYILVLIFLYNLKIHNWLTKNVKHNYNY